MRISPSGFIGLATALLITSFASPASAVVTLDQSLASGWTQGSGTTNDHFTVDTETNGVELGLRASLRFVGFHHADRRSLHCTGGHRRARQGIVEF